jgi:hypothetical protein
MVRCQACDDVVYIPDSKSLRNYLKGIMTTETSTTQTQGEMWMIALRVATPELKACSTGEYGSGI